MCCLVKILAQASRFVQALQQATSFEWDCTVIAFAVNFLDLSISVQQSQFHFACYLQPHCVHVEHTTQSNTYSSSDHTNFRKSVWRSKNTNTYEAFEHVEVGHCHTCILDWTSLLFSHRELMLIQWCISMILLQLRFLSCL